MSSLIDSPTTDSLVLDTERLVLRRLQDEDAAFIFELVNQPSFIQNIGDRKVRTLDDAVRYIQNGPVSSYSQHGFGLYRVELKESGVPIGICGLLKREILQEPDVGFAFLPQSWGLGYALESAAAVMRYGRQEFGMTRIAAIVNPDNQRSIKLLKKLGFRFEGTTRVSENEPPVSLFLSESQDGE